MKFELGDTAVVMANNHYRNMRKPVTEGTVTARGKNCVRLRILRRFLFWEWTVEKWYPIEHAYQHVEKTEQY